MIQSSDGINRILCCSYVVCVCVVWKTRTQIVFSGDFSIAISILRINNQSNEWRSLTAGVHSAHKLTDTWTMPHERRQTRAHDNNDGVNGTMWQLNSVKRLSPSLSFSYVSQVCDWQRAASSLSLFLFQFVLPVFLWVAGAHQSILPHANSIGLFLCINIATEIGTRHLHEICWAT